MLTFNLSIDYSDGATDKIICHNVHSFVGLWAGTE